MCSVNTAPIASPRASIRYQDVQFQRLELSADREQRADVPISEHRVIHQALGMAPASMPAPVTETALMSGDFRDRFHNASFNKCRYQMPSVIS
jgi:hypothetical protein